jgi:hypothetical protein
LRRPAGDPAATTPLPKGESPAAPKATDVGALGPADDNPKVIDGPDDGATEVGCVDVPDAPENGLPPAAPLGGMPNVMGGLPPNDDEAPSSPPAGLLAAPWKAELGCVAAGAPKENADDAAGFPCESPVFGPPKEKGLAAAGGALAGLSSSSPSSPSPPLAFDANPSSSSIMTADGPDLKKPPAEAVGAAGVGVDLAAGPPKLEAGGGLTFLASTGLDAADASVLDGADEAGVPKLKAGGAVPAFFASSAL